MTKPIILFITGVNAAGKTTLYQNLEKDPVLQGFEIHDIDENGVPEVGRTPWRAFRIEELYYNATKFYDRGKSSIIVGIMFPHEIIESEYYQEKFNVHFILLDLTYANFKKRLDARITESKSAGNYMEKNYSALLQYNRRKIRALHNMTLNQKNGHIVSTDDKTPAQIAAEVKKLIKTLGIKSHK